MLQIQNSKNRIQNAQNKTLEKIASGLNINRAVDDAVGLSISEGMRAQIRGLEQAWMNVQNAESLVQTTDGIVQEITEHVQRMRELTVKALNDTLTDSDRGQLQKEYRKLQESITSMSRHTKFNDPIPAVEMDSPAFGKLEGDHVFVNTVQIIAGWNDQLILSTDVKDYPITLPEGSYPSIEQLIDAIDTDIYIVPIQM